MKCPLILEENLKCYKFNETYRHNASLILFCRFVPHLVDIYEAVWSNHDPDFFDDDLWEDEADSEFLKLLTLIRTILWNYADGSPNFAESIVDDTHFFQYLTEDLTAVQDDLKDLEDEITVYFYQTI